MKTIKIITKVLEIAVALIILQTLYFKFTGHPFTVELFTIIGVEPWGRFFVGVIELITGTLILVPKTTRYGLILSTLVGIGAIFTHLIFIGVNYGGDVSLFLMAVFISIVSPVCIFLERKSEK